MNRAEALAKQGQYGRALTDLNTIRERAIVGGGYSSLSASNAGELIDKERQLELAYEYIESWYNRKRIHSAINYMTPQAAHEAA